MAVGTTGWQVRKERICSSVLDMLGLNCLLGIHVVLSGCWIYEYGDHEKSGLEIYIWDFSVSVVFRIKGLDDIT